MASQHYEQFVANLDYARNMVVGGRALSGLRNAGANFGDLAAAHPEDLYRAAWSQAVSALDHWLHLEVRDQAVALVESQKRPLPERLAKLPLPLSTVEEMAQDSQATVFRQFVTEEIRRHTYQRSKGITEGLRLITADNADDIWRRIGKVGHLSAAEARREQDAVADRRNQIAHRADLADDGRRMPMADHEVERAIEWIAYVADRITEEFLEPVEEEPGRAWLVRAGSDGEREEWALTGGRAGGGFIAAPDLTALESKEELSEALAVAYAEAYEQASPNFISNHAGQLWRLREAMAVGDLVVLPLKRTSRIAIGRIRGEYAYEAGAPEDERHRRPVEWLRVDIQRDVIGQDLLNSLGAFLTICEVWRNDGAWRIDRLLKTGRDPGPRAGEG